MIASAIKQIFMLGLIPPYRDEIENFVESEFSGVRGIPSEAVFVERCIAHFDLTTVKPLYEWLAYHEAGHVIVGLKARLPIRGVRFHANGETGLALMRDPKWRHTTNKSLLRRLIAVDVAGIVAENMAGKVRNPTTLPHELLSTWYDGRLVPGAPCPSDFQLADVKAHLLDKLISGQPVKAWDDSSVWPAKKAILQRAENRAIQILGDNADSLDRLAAALMNGPITGTEIRRIVREVK